MVHTYTELPHLLMGVYVTNRKVAGSRPDEMNDFFFINLPNPSSRTMPWGLLSL
jgi:hypothetical protein